MPRFATVRDAKEFLVGRIVAEAQRCGTALCEAEEKMLYFSETGWTLPDVAEVKATFDRDYNQRRYERKIAGLIRQIRATGQEGDKSALRAWDEAVRRIWDEDHYLLVMIDQASRPGMSLGHIARLGAMVLAGTAIMLVAVWFFMFR